MGSGASGATGCALAAASNAEVEAAVAALAPEELSRLAEALRQGAGDVCDGEVDGSAAGGDGDGDGDRVCRICLDSAGELHASTCACRGSQAHVHLACLKQLAENHTGTGDDVHSGKSSDGLGSYRVCPTCKECYIGAARLYLAREMWSKYEALAHEHENRMLAEDILMTALQETGHIAEARRMLREKYETLKGRYGIDHFHTIVAANNLSNALDSPFERLELMRNAVVSAEKSFGKEHPNTLAMTYNQATAIKDCGRWNEAVELLQCTLDVCTRVLGEQHEYSIGCLKTLAECLGKRGDGEIAQEKIEAALVLSKRVFGSQHPHTLAVQDAYGGILIDRGRLDDAVKRMAMAVNASKRISGDEHPDTLSMIVTLGKALRLRGDVARAESLLQDAMSGLSRIAGFDGGEKLCCARELAIVLFEKGEVSHGKELLAPTLESMRNLYGPDHPDTLSCSEAYALYVGR